MMTLEVQVSMAPVLPNDTTIEQPCNTLRKKRIPRPLPPSCLFQFLVLYLVWGRQFLYRKHLKPEAMPPHHSTPHLPQMWSAESSYSQKQQENCITPCWEKTSIISQFLNPQQPFCEPEGNCGSVQAGRKWRDSGPDRMLDMSVFSCSQKVVISEVA